MNGFCIHEFSLDLFVSSQNKSLLPCRVNFIILYAAYYVAIVDQMRIIILS